MQNYGYVLIGVMGCHKANIPNNGYFYILTAQMFVLYHVTDHPLTPVATLYNWCEVSDKLKLKNVEHAM